MEERDRDERELDEGTDGREVNKIGIAHDYFPDDTFEREEAEKDDDEILDGSEGGDGNEGGPSESNEFESEEEVAGGTFYSLNKRRRATPL